MQNSSNGVATESWALGGERKFKDVRRLLRWMEFYGPSLRGLRNREECSQNTRGTFIRRGNKAGIAGGRRLEGPGCQPEAFDLDP